MKKYGGSFKDDVWEFDTNSSQWKQLNPMPFVVSRHSSCTIGDKIIIQTYKEILVYEKGCVRIQPTFGEKPTGLSMCACTSIGSAFILFGGTSKAREMSNDVYKLDKSLMAKWGRFVKNNIKNKE